MDDTYDTVMRSVGGVTKLADLLGESTSTVGNWRARGFPANRARAISELSGVSVRDLRPNDWHEYWPELVTNDQAAPSVRST